MYRINHLKPQNRVIDLLSMVAPIGGKLSTNPTRLNNHIRFTLTHPRAGELKWHLNMNYLSSSD